MLFLISSILPLKHATHKHTQKTQSKATETLASVLSQNNQQKEEQLTTMVTSDCSFLLTENF